MILDRETVKDLRRCFPEGSRVELISMNDPYTKLKSGDKGTVRSVDDVGTIHVSWDSGSSLGVVFGVDKVKKID